MMYEIEIKNLKGKKSVALNATFSNFSKQVFFFNFIWDITILNKFCMMTAQQTIKMQLPKRLRKKQNKKNHFYRRAISEFVHS